MPFRPAPLSRRLRRPRYAALLTAAGLALGVAVAAPGPARAATNLLVNPGFEAGNLSGWTCSATDSVTSSPVHSGSDALDGAATSGDDAQCSQTVSVQPSSSYTLAGYVEGHYVYLGDSGTGTSATSTWTPSAASWQRLSTSFTTGSATTSVTVYVHGWYGQGSYYADDLTLTGPAGGGGGGTPPAAPTGLGISGTTASSVSLSWTAPPGTVTGYDIYENGTRAGTTTGTSDTIAGLAASASYTFTVAAYNSAGTSPASAPVQATTQSSDGGGGGGGSGGNWRSPVYLMPLDNNPPTTSSIAGIMSNTGERDFMLSFVLDSGGCTPAWDGNSGDTVASDTTVANLIAAIRSAGGGAGVSFGGYNGTELGQSCSSASSLAAAYQSVITRYHLTHVDFDIENTALGDTSDEYKRFEAIKILEGEDPGLVVSLTIPVTTIGLPGTGVSEIQQAIKAGARIDVFGFMDFDYGLASGLTQAGSDETVANDVASQLESLYGWTSATAWSHMGMTLMNGHTDQPSELFTTATFSSLLGFVQGKHAAWLSFWSLNRDLQCPAGAQEPWNPGDCSGITQAPYAFTTIVAQYAG